MRAADTHITRPSTFIAYGPVGRIHLTAATRSEAILESRRYPNTKRIVEVKEMTVWSKEDRGL
jgi:hypothetical protein